jgi:IMP dehydrogenase
MKKALEALRLVFDDKVHIIAGNIATLEGFNDLADWGADSVRCNIGGGSICSTRIQTGHGLPGLQTVLDCAQSDRDAKIIADGGIRSSGDMVKAFAAGADFVMVGSLLAGTTESPGTLGTAGGAPVKRYRGMASKEAQIKWQGHYNSNEGISTHIPYKGSVQPILDDLIKGIRSGLSYSGARNLTELCAKARFERQTAAARVEGTAHILGRP